MGGGSSQPNSVNPGVVNNQGVGTQIQSNTDFNVYGNDLANFAKFKGNDKYDAMTMTRTASTDVKKAFMQLQHEFPYVQITFDEMPNPQKYGKGREGFHQYQKALDVWKDTAMAQIANAREITTAEEFAETRGTVVKGAIATMDTVNARADGLTDQIDQRADGLEEKVETEGKQTRSAVHAEGRKTRNAVHAEGNATRFAVKTEGVATRQAVRDSERRLHRHINDTAEDLHEHIDTTREDIAEEGQKTRENTDEKTKQTQVLDSILSGISDKLSDRGLNKSTINRIENMKNRIMTSDLSFNRKKEYLEKLDTLVSNTITKEKMDSFDEELNKDNVYDSYSRPKIERPSEKPDIEKKKYPAHEYQIPDEQMPKEPKGKEVPKRVNPFDKHIPKEQTSDQPKGLSPKDKKEFEDWLKKDFDL